MKTFINYDLTNHNSYQLKSTCKTAFFPEVDNDIHLLFNKSASKKILLGGGYNVVLTQDYYDSEFVLFSGNYNHVKIIAEDKLLCESGCDMKVLSEFALQNSLSGLEIYWDIPSSLGGAIVMNAGAGGEDIKALLIEVHYYNPNTENLEVIGRDQINFEYRNSFFQKNPEMVVCRALLQLSKSDPKLIREKMETTKNSRWAKQPREFPNAGSVFKRPPGRFVGAMIDELGLKGFSIGGAKISEKHSGFIVNFDNATGVDIMELIRHVKAKVKEKFHLDLEIEQRII